MALIIGTDRKTGNGLDVAKMVNMALLHDLAETSTGDIIPSDGISREDKERLEERAIKKILIDIDKSGDLFNIWKEYAQCKTEEARLVNALDKLEMACQAKEYQVRSGADLSGFMEQDKDLQDDVIDEIYQILISDTSSDLKKID
jgi:putative hydrolase of HD superfamily